MIDLAEIATFIAGGGVQILRPAYATNTSGALPLTEEQLRATAVAVRILRREDRVETLKRILARAGRRSSNGSNWWSGAAA